MKLLRFLLAASALLLPGCIAAHADTFGFSFGTDSSKFQGSGTLTGTLIAPDEYLITAVTGTTRTTKTDDLTIAGIEAPGAFEGNDNDLFLDPTTGTFMFDGAGLAYDLTNGAQVSISQSVLGGLEILERAKSGNIVPELEPYSVTPEPGSFVLLGTGLLGVVGAARRRFAA